MTLWKIYRNACYRVADAITNGLRKWFDHYE